MRLILDYYYLFLLCPCVCVCVSNQSCSAHLVSSRHTGARLTMKDWRGIRPPVDATMVGRVILAPKPTSPPPRRRWSSRKSKSSRNRKQRRRLSRFAYFYDLWSYDDLFDDDLYTVGRATQQQQRTPVQNVYFFQKGMNKGLPFFKVKALFYNKGVKCFSFFSHNGRQILQSGPADQTCRRCLPALPTIHC